MSARKVVALLGVLAIWCVGLVRFPVLAHEMTMAEMDVHETTPGEFLWQWTATNDKRPGTSDLQLHWPSGCNAAEALVHCGANGLKGALEIEGTGRNYSAVLVRITWLDGQSYVYTLTPAQPRVMLYGGVQDRRDGWEIARTYTTLGVEHILTGYDHLLFVLGLLFLVGFQRKLIWTITAFTAAHSVTLASAALGILTLRSPPVEASIALSIVLVVGEALHPRQTLARRWPALLAFLFGLVHGLGFAGALKDVGLPQNYLPTALVTFNVGVELGQLLTLGVVWLLWFALKRWPVFERGRTPALYAMGSIAAYWSWLRIAALLT
jgi:hydrogenase/urease accessory protein HupE